MRQLILLTVWILALSSTQVAASGTYKNWEYRFVVNLIGNETICSQDAHGVTVAFSPKGCGRSDVNISASYDGELSTEFPTKSQRETCGVAKILTTQIYLGKVAWRMCILKSRADFVELFYFNRLVVPRSPLAAWKLYSVDARVPATNESRRKLESLLQRTRTN
jgi:hypothetical protein